MSGKMFAFVCSVLFLIVSSSKSQQNFTNENDNFKIRYEINMDSTTNYNDEIITLRHVLHKMFINNTQNDTEFYTNDNREDNDLFQHKLNKHSMQNKDDEQKSMKSNTNTTNVNHKRNFMSQEVHENVIEKNDSMSLEVFENSSKDANETNIVPNDMCHNDNCIQLCCSLGDRLVDGKCIPEGIEYIFPKVYTNDSTQSEKRVNELFQLTIYDPCQDEDHVLSSGGVQYDTKIFTDGSIYLIYYKIVITSSYCLAVADGNEFEVTICSKTYDFIKDIFDDENDDKIDGKKIIRIIYLSFRIVSMLLLGSVFLVYSILPELRNRHGFMLRNYSGALFVAYGIQIVDFRLTRWRTVEDPVCITKEFFSFFCVLASSFWLNIMSFNMWWTFRSLCLLQKNVKQQQRMKLLFYAIYAWGIPFILAIVWSTIDYIPSVPEIFQPNICRGEENEIAFILYYHVLKSMCVISSIYLSISAALQIGRYKKDTSHRLKNLESKCYNDNKKWFNLYLKLFIVLFILIGIKWFMITAVLFYENKLISYIIWHAINLLDIVQNFCSFIIFVWKKKIKRMLFKRFSCSLLRKARSESNATSSSIITTSKEIDMQEKMSLSGRARRHTDSTDF